MIWLVLTLQSKNMTNVDIVRKAQSSFLQSGRPDIRTGMEIEVHQKIKEGNKERVQRFKGIVIKTAGKSELEKTITVRRKVGAFGVEKIFAVHSPTIEKIDVLRQFKVRRKSIKFIRELTGKAARLKEVSSDSAVLNAEKPLPVVEMPEAPVKEETPTKEETTNEAPAENTEAAEAPKTEEKVEEVKEEVAEAPVETEKTEEAPKEEAKKEEK